MTFEAAALARVLEESQCYPYFLQLFGAALWDAAPRNGAAPIDAAVVTQASAVFDQRRGTYYHHRRNELERAGLLGVASRLATAFAARATMAQAEVDAAIAESAEDAIRIRDDLAALGYIWNPPGERDVWRPGVPSLMAHVETVSPPG